MGGGVNEGRRKWNVWIARDVAVDTAPPYAPPAWPRRHRQSDFFTKPEIKEAYRGFVHTITSRVNTINGRKFSDDPTIMAWNLLNECVHRARYLAGCRVCAR